MAIDTDPLFRALAEDADRGRLDGPADLRRRSDRRTAVRTAGGMVVVVALVAAVLVGGGALRSDSTGGLAPVAPPSPTATTMPKSDFAPLVRIPASAWLDSTDVNDSADPIESGEELLRPCTEALMGPSDSQVTVSGAVFGFYRAPDLPLDYVPDGTVRQIIRVYRPETLDLVLTRLASIVAACPTGATSQPDPGQPDLVSLVRLTTMQGDTPVRSWVAVVRVEDTVSLLWLQGWEGTSSREVDARRLAASTAARLHAWLD